MKTILARSSPSRRAEPASWPVGRVAGVAIRVHVTFPILLALLAAVEYSRHGSLADAGEGVVFSLALFGLILLHELGHVLAARRCGVRTLDITLYPIGGVARLERAPTRPRDELGIALAGPAVNLALAAAYYAWAGSSGVAADLEEPLLESSLGARLAVANVVLALFNLLPAFPLDGGRALRALLAMKLEYTRATLIATWLGESLAVLFGLAGLLLGNPILVLVALFVWFEAAAEMNATRLRSALAGMEVQDLMTTEFHVLDPDDPLQRAVEYGRAAGRQNFPVVKQADPVGLLRWEALVSALDRAGPGGRVGDFMEPLPRAARPSEPVERALEQAQSDGADVVPVMREHALVGLLTLAGVAESARLLGASRRARPA